MYKPNAPRPRKDPGHIAAAAPRLPNGALRDGLIKRGIDIVAAVVAIIFVSPLMIVCAVWTGAVFGTWPLARQVCVGQYGRQFCLLTFRTRLERNDSDALFDIRKRRVGGVLALSNLDRLPELLNLLRGDLSLVGPRPLSYESHQYYVGRTPGSFHRAQVKPGILGWAQLHQREALLDIRRQIQLDIWYAQNQSLRLDFRILLLSLRRVLSDKG